MQFKDEQRLHFIVEKLTILAMQTKAMGKLNMLDSNVSSEYFYCQYFNTLFDLKLRSSNEKNSHEEAIDLYDDDNRVVVQVSSRSDAAKIEGALASDKSKERPGYRFIYICIIDTDGKKPKTINNKGSFLFDSSKDFFDINGIIKKNTELHVHPKNGRFVQTRL